MPRHSVSVSAPSRVRARRPWERWSWWLRSGSWDFGPLVAEAAIVAVLAAVAVLGTVIGPWLYLT